jgi:GDP-4-dehydro-6-deoxy-D-mannose reductase
VVSDFARQIAEAEQTARDATVTVDTGNLETRRDFTDVRDVVRAYAALVDRQVTGAFNVCTGRSVTVAEVLSGLSELTSLEVLSVSETDLIREGEILDLRGSHAKLTEATGWQPEIPLSRTLADVLDWWRARVQRQGAG